MDRGAWQATVHGVAKSRTQLSNFTYLFRGFSPLVSPPKLLSWRHGGGNIWSVKSLFNLILPHLVTRSA